MQRHPCHKSQGCRRSTRRNAVPHTRGTPNSFFGLLPEKSVNLVVTSPPYALHFEKEYGNVAKADYVDWFRPFGEQIFRVLQDDGSFVLNIGGSYNKGAPTVRSTISKSYSCCARKWGSNSPRSVSGSIEQSFPPQPKWVNVPRMRNQDAVEYVWWFSKTDWPKADNTRVLSEYSRGHAAVDRTWFSSEGPAKWLEDDR